MENKVIFAPKGTEYLSQINNFTKIPENCLFNKGRTGCGATEMAITDQRSTIIAMPTKELIRNKTVERTDKIEVLGVFEGVTDRDIKLYMHTHEVWKIAVTYDSIQRVTRIAQRAGFDVYNDVFMLVDEWHLLFGSLDFRYRAIKRTLDEVTQFKHATLMSATPVADKYLFEQLKQYRKVKIEWEENSPINVESYITRMPAEAVVILCQQAFKCPHNAHFFVNSVEFIAKVIKASNLTPEQVRIVCSTSGESFTKNREKLGASFSIESTKDPVKKINFYTSTSFEGCDIYDKQGRTYIVVVGSKSHTLLDIPTAFRQVCGRLRDSHYQNDITLVFSSSYNSCSVSVTDFALKTRQAYRGAQSYCRMLNSQSEDERAVFSEMHKDTTWLDERYMKIENERFEVERDLLNLEMAKYRLQNYVYTNSHCIMEELKANGFNITKHNSIAIDERLRIASNPKERCTFREAFVQYCDQMDNAQVFDVGRIIAEQMATSRPFVKQAYDQLGRSMVESLNYNPTQIKRRLTALQPTSLIDRVVAMCRQEFKEGSPIPLSVIKETLQGIYNELGVKCTAKATNLDDWCETLDSSISKSGQKIKCKTIVRYKIVRHK